MPDTPSRLAARKTKPPPSKLKCHPFRAMFSMQRSRLYDEVKEVHPVVGAVAVEIMIDEVDHLSFGIQSEAILSQCASAGSYPMLPSRGY